MSVEPDVEEIIIQMTGRIAGAYPDTALVSGKKILDIACGSNSSRLPASFSGGFFNKKKGFTALFEPWFCRILFELGAEPAGIDIGDLNNEDFIYFHADLGIMGALKFLPDESFDAVHDSRLFGSPEFTERFKNEAEIIQIAEEIVQGMIIHSDALNLLL